MKHVRLLPDTDYWNSDFNKTLQANNGLLVKVQEETRSDITVLVMYQGSQVSVTLEKHRKGRVYIPAGGIYNARRR